MIPIAKRETVEGCIGALGARHVPPLEALASGGFAPGYRKLARGLAARPPHVRHNLAAIVHCLRGAREPAVAHLEASLGLALPQPEFQALLAEILLAAGAWEAYPRKGEFGLEIVAALRGLARPPERYHPALVGRLFDRLSPGYEERVMREGYAEHTEVARCLAALPGCAAGKRVLDLGCGTGMLGEALREAGCRAALVGVDASPAMLEQARARGSYAELHCDDLARFLGSRAGALAADAVGMSSVIPFFGPLEGLFRLLGAALERGAWLVFSHDLAEGEGVQFNEHGRYRHEALYVEGALAGAGFRVESRSRFTARLERGRPVAGAVVVALRS